MENPKISLDILVTCKVAVFSREAAKVCLLYLIYLLERATVYVTEIPRDNLLCFTVK